MLRTKFLVLLFVFLAVAASALGGPYSTYNGVGSNACDQPITASDPRLVEWASPTNYLYAPAPGAGPSFQNPAGFLSLGDLYDPASPPATGQTPDHHNGYDKAHDNPAGGFPFNGNVNDTTDTYGFLGIDNPGSITVTFDRAICNGVGPDFAVFENGFRFTYPWTGFFAELAYVEVSSNGVDFARFDSVSLNTGYGANKGWDMSNVYNLAGKHEKGLGTPFDLAELASNPLVTSGLVDLNDIAFLRLVDIPGSGYFKDSATNVIDPTTGQFYTANHSIYDPWVTYDSGGFDFRFFPDPATGDTASVGVLNSVPEPGTLVILITATLACTLLTLRARPRTSPLPLRETPGESAL